MPVIPTVFNSIRPGDVLSTPVKTYKRYRITSEEFYGTNNRQIHPDSASGYRIHAATWKYRPPNLYDDYPFVNVSGFTAASSSTNILSGYRDSNISSWPFNPDGTNTHVVWKSIDHRYYRNPYDPSTCHELSTRDTEKYYFTAASVLTIPYFDMGERIKAGSVTASVTYDGTTTTLYDDGKGNLLDSVSTRGGLFLATSSLCFFYMGFQNEFRQTETGHGLLRENESVEYTLVDTVHKAAVSNVSIRPGVDMINPPAAVGPYTSSGLCAGFGFNDDPQYNTQTTGIQIPHNELFNRFNPCDRWTISFWVNVGDTTRNQIIMTKRALREEFRRNKKTQILEQKLISYQMQGPISQTARYNNYKMPFHIFTRINALYFVCSNGTTALSLNGPISQNTWHHVAIVRSNSATTLYIDGTQVDTSTISLPGNTQNDSYIEIGSCGGFTRGTNGYTTKNLRVDEIRFYEYDVTKDNPNVLANLAGREWNSTINLYQTPVAGNVFYRNGQIVVSSPLPKYNQFRYIDSGRGYQMRTGSNDLGGFFGRRISDTPSWTVEYRGVHTVYENEVMVRIPGDQFNYTYNPTATYRPGTGADDNDCNTNLAGAQSKNEPGDLYLDMFVSGTVGPYITTIGLYNDQAQLLAIGKLAMPVYKTPDFDMNFIIRWDY